MILYSYIYDTVTWQTYKVLQYCDMDKWTRYNNTIQWHSKQTNKQTPKQTNKHTNKQCNTIHTNKVHYITSSKNFGTKSASMWLAWLSPGEYLNMDSVGVVTPVEHKYRSHHETHMGSNWIQTAVSHFMLQTWYMNLYYMHVPYDF